MVPSEALRLIYPDWAIGAARFGPFWPGLSSPLVLAQASPPEALRFCSSALGFRHRWFGWRPQSCFPLSSVWPLL